jgi:hypothetical protein
MVCLFFILKRYEVKEYRWILYFIAAFIGFTLNFSTEDVDGFRHEKDFLESLNWNWNDFIVQLGVITLRSTDTVDYYVTVVNFFVGRVFSNPSYVFAIHAVVFSFFYLKVLNLAYDDFSSKGWQRKLFLFGLIILFPITQLNALRYPIALWIWSFGALSYLKTNRIKYIGVSLFASLVHLGITPASGILVIYHLIGKKTNLYFGLYLVSFLVSNIFSFDFLIALTEGLGEGIEGRATDYLSENYSHRRATGISNVNWYVNLRYSLLNSYVVLGVVYLYFSRKNIIQDEFQKHLIGFTMLYAAYINMVIDIPSFGGRQRFFLWIIVIFSLYRTISLNRVKSKWMSYLAILPITLYGLVETRVMFYYLSFDSLFSNPIFALIKQSDISLDQILR